MQYKDDYSIKLTLYASTLQVLGHQLKADFKKGLNFTCRNNSLLVQNI